MTFQVPQNTNHVADLLPTYVNGTLDQASAGRVREHLLHCEACRLELSTWEAIGDVTQFATTSAPLPSASVLNQVWAKIDSPAQEVLAHQTSLKHRVIHLWLVLTRQIRIIHTSIWIVSALVVFFGCGLALFDTLASPGHMQDAELFLALVASVVGACGAAFIYGVEHDTGFEITLSTPTSIRIVMLCRMALVVGYNAVVSALASGILAVAHGGGLWGVIQLWLGPMLLLASISIALTLLIGSALAIVASLILEATQALPIYFEKGLIGLQLARPDLWQTNPTILLLAILFFVFAVFYAPRQPRLS